MPTTSLTAFTVRYFATLRTKTGTRLVTRTKRVKARDADEAAARVRSSTRGFQGISHVEVG